jgi:hypothetical protein
MQEGWTTVASKTLVKDRWIDLRADQCLTPNGHEISPYYVLTYSDWINVVAITPDARFGQRKALLQQSDAGSDDSSEAIGGPKR